MPRITKDMYYLGIADAVSRRSTCIRRRYGAVLVKNDEIIATGYNGSPRGDVNCCDSNTCQRESLNVPKGQRYELCVAVHAEDNAITSAGRGRALNSDLYIIGHNADETPADPSPCLMCARKIKNAGVKRVVGLVNGEPKILQTFTE